MTPLLFSTGAVAKTHACTSEAVRAAIRRGDLRAVRIGDRLYVLAESALTWTPMAVGRPRKHPKPVEIEGEDL